MPLRPLFAAPLPSLSRWFGRRRLERLIERQTGASARGMSLRELELVLTLLILH